MLKYVKQLKTCFLSWLQPVFLEQHIRFFRSVKHGSTLTSSSWFCKEWCMRASKKLLHLLHCYMRVRQLKRLTVCSPAVQQCLITPLFWGQSGMNRTKEGNLRVNTFWKWLHITACQHCKAFKAHFVWPLLAQFCPIQRTTWMVQRIIREFLKWMVWLWTTQVNESMVNYPNEWFDFEVLEWMNWWWTIQMNDSTSNYVNEWIQ